MNNCIEFFTKKAVTESEGSKRFKSRLTLKALCAIYLKMVKKELGRTGPGDLAKLKSNI